MLHRYRYLAWLAFLLPLAARAQNSFRPGYVVRPAGDTLRGEVQLRSELRNATLCRFRPAATAAMQEYKPTELRGYGATVGPAYQARLVPATATEPSAVLFVRVLAAGRASLYTRRTAYDDTRFYVMVGSDSLLELTQRRVQRIVGDQVLYEDLRPYRALLARRLQACPAVQSLLPQLVLAAGPLTRVVERYNACLGDAPPRRLAVEKARLGFGLAAGLGRGSVNFSKQLPMQYGSFSATGVPSVGVYVDFMTPALNRNFSLRLDALYMPVTYAAAYATRNLATVEVRQQASYALHYLRLPLQLRYRVPLGKVQPFVLVGVKADVILAANTHLHSEYTSASGTIVSSEGTGLPENGLVRTDLGFLVGAGVQTPGFGGHALGLELRLEYGEGFVRPNTSPTMLLGVLGSFALTR